MSNASSSEVQEPYQAVEREVLLAGRTSADVSRSSLRPTEPSTPTQRLQPSQQAAHATEQQQAARARQERQAARAGAKQVVAKREEILRAAANSAESYAEELASDEWVLPTSGFHISTWFGEAGPYWSRGYHTGIDFATAYGTPAISVTNATVIQAGWDGPYGNQIRLRIEGGDEVWYNHLSSIEVSVGESVVKGQAIGRIGDTGNSFGAHLHFEYRLASDVSSGVDPRPFFAEHGITL